MNQQYYYICISSGGQSSAMYSRVIRAVAGQRSSSESHFASKTFNQKL